MNNNSYIKEFNRRKAVLAKQSKISRWLAEQLGKSVNTVSKWWYVNNIQTSREQLDKIAKVFNMDIRLQI